MERIPQLHRLPGPENSLLAGECPFRPHANLYQHLCHAVTGIEIVVYNQRFQALQLRDLLYTATRRLDPQRQTDCKFGALALLCLDLNGAAHHIHDVFGDGHAKACALGPADGGGPLPLKGRKDLLHKFLTHADPVVFDPELIQCAALGRSRKLLQPDRNRPARWGELDRIGQ